MNATVLLIFVPLILLLASSLPIGVWALAVLLRSDVRRAFDVDSTQRPG